MSDAPLPPTAKQAKRSILLIGLIFLLGIPIYGVVAYFIEKDVGKPIDSRFTEQQVQTAFLIGCAVALCLSWGIRWLLTSLASRHTAPEERPMAFARAVILGMGIAETPAVFGLVAYLLTANAKILGLACSIAAVAVLSHIAGTGSLCQDDAGETTST